MERAKVKRDNKTFQCSISKKHPTGQGNVSLLQRGIVLCLERILPIGGILKTKAEARDINKQHTVSKTYDEKLAVSPVGRWSGSRPGRTRARLNGERRVDRTYPWIEWSRKKAGLSEWGSEKSPKKLSALLRAEGERPQKH